MTSRFERLSLVDRSLLVGLLSATIVFLFPNLAAAQANDRLVFEINNIQTIKIPHYSELAIIKSADENQVTDEQATEPALEVDPNVEILKNYLISKNSPLAEYSEHLLSQPNWKMIIAISQSESNMCKRQLGHNCWGIGGGNLRKYPSFAEGISDANNVISKYVARGADTPDEMVLRYVAWNNRNWVKAANQTLGQLNNLPLVMQN
ncbi:MAG: hypothetical protein ACM3NH_01255 [Candidatus Saccharibacteria bacterium]